MKAKSNRRKKNTRKMIMNKFKFSAVLGTYICRRWSIGVIGGIEL